MKRLLAASALALLPFSALAADLPSRAPAIAPAPVSARADWTGCYVGVGVGFVSMRNSTPLAAGLYDGGKNIAESGTLSGRIGCDYQVNNFVFGAYGSFDKMSLNGSNEFYPVGPGFPEILTTKATWSASAGARVGYVIQPRFLAYLKGGLAWTELKHADYDINPVTSFYGRADSPRKGWTVGGGVEYALTANWSAFVEYNHVDYGSKTVTITDGIIYQGGPWNNSYKNKADIVTVGAQYKFSLSSAPVVARY